MKTKNGLMTGHKKGILLTLLIVVLFLLMVGELLFYVALNTNYNALAESASASSNQGALINNVQSGMHGFLHTSLYSAVWALSKYENSSSLRYGNFITNSSAALASLMTNGTVYGTNMSSAMGGATLSTYLTSLQTQAGAQAANLIFTSSNIIIYQTTPFAINVTYTGTATATTAYGKYIVPLTVNSSVNINGLPDLWDAQIQQPSIITLLQNAPQATVIGNLTASYSSASPFMSAYGTIYLTNPAGICNMPSQYQTTNYILADADAGSTTNNACHMAGLITCNGDLPSMYGPELIYSPANGGAASSPCSTIFNALVNGTQVLIDGPARQLLNVTPIQTAINNGYWFPSPYAPSYLDRAQGSMTHRSPAGITTFNQYQMLNTLFNGNNANIVVASSASLDPPGSLTVLAWVYPTALPSAGNIEAIAVKWGQTSTKDEYFLGMNSAGQVLVALGNGLDENGHNTAQSLMLNTWQQVGLVYNGAEEYIVVNGQLFPVNALAGSSVPATPVQFSIGGQVGSGTPFRFFSGRISDVQVYNSAVPGNAIFNLYQQGLGAPPVPGAGIGGWWPLNSANKTAAADQSGNGNTGTDYFTSIAPLNGYAGDPLLYGPQPDYSADAATFSTGKSQYGNVPSQGSDFAYGNQPSSAFAWMFPRSYPSAWAMILTYGPASIPTAGARALSISSGGNECFNSNGDDYCGSLPIKLNAWNFIGYTYSAGAANNIAVFLNGNVINGTLSKQLVTAQGTACIGAWGSCLTPAFYWNGSIANIQVYNSPISTAQAWQLYQEGIQGGPVTTNGLAAWWPLNSNWNDYSGNNNNAAPLNGANFTPAVSTPVPQPIYGVQGCGNPTQCSNSTFQPLFLGSRPLESAGNGGSQNESASLGLPFAGMPDVLSFNALTGGTANMINPIGWLQAPGSQSQTINSFSVSIWVYPTTTNGVILNEQASGGWFDQWIDIFSGSAYVQVWGAGCQSIGAIPLNQWSMITLTYNDMTPKLYGYINGVQKVSGAAAHRSTTLGVPYYSLGGPSGGSGCPSGQTIPAYSGMMSDLQIYNRNLTIAQVQQLYNNDSVVSQSANMIWRLSGPLYGAYNMTPELITGDNFQLTSITAGGVFTPQCTSANVLKGTCPELWRAP